MREKVESALDEIRPLLQADGGNVEVVDVDKGVVTLRLTGACNGCALAAITLENVVGRVIKEKVPEVKEINTV